MFIRSAPGSPLRAAFVARVALAFALGTAFIGAASVQAQHSAGHAAAAPAVKLGSLTIEEPWSRATAPGASVGGGFLVLDNAGADDRLVAASSPVSARVELHTMSMQDNVMRMREVEHIEVPAGKRVELRPGGLHLMFIELKAPLEEGRSFPVTLRFERAGEVEVQMSVRSMGAGAMHH